MSSLSLKMSIRLLSILKELYSMPNPIIQLWWLWLILSYFAPYMLIIAVPTTILAVLSLFDLSELNYKALKGKPVKRDMKKLTRDIMGMDEPIQKKKLFLAEAYGMRSKQINEYHTRIYHDEYPWYFDWYHTTGTLMVCHNNGTTKLTKDKDTEHIAAVIIRYVHNYLDNTPKLS